MNLNNICEGCLSTDRKLSVVFDSLVRQVFSNFIGDSDFIKNPLALCWECSAIIKKIVKYKVQVQDAHQRLIEYMLRQPDILPPLSSLTTHKITEESHIITQCDVNNSEKSPLRNTRIVRNNDIQTDDKDNSTKSLSIAHVQSLSKTETQDEIVESEKEREPIFIKVEIETDNSFNQDAEEGIDDYYADEDLQSKLKTSITSDASECSSKSSGKSKKSITKTVAEFSDSDYEPLKKESKPKKRKKKTEKAKSGTRERASGVVQSAIASRTVHKLGVQPGVMEEIRLSWQEVEDERQKALASDSYLRHDHRCEDCALGFNHKSKLDNHMKKHQPSAGELCCAVCRVRCRTQHALAAHKRRHRIRWRCALCGELGSRAAVVADHCARVHGTSAPTHTCAVCGHVAPTLSKLRNHLKNHGERQKCELCDKTFRDKSTLKTHLFIHKGEKEHACPTCGKMFLFKKAMQLHAATHDASALLYCHECDMNFKNQMSYYQHMKYNLKHVDPARLKHECSICGKKFIKASRLAEHTTAIHLKLTPVQCPQPACGFSMKASRLAQHTTAIHLKLTPVQCPQYKCGFACASRAVLRAHLRTIHRQQRAARNHVCHACGKAYTNKKTLEGHLRAHSGERPFACARCGAAFGYHAALYNHTRLVHLKQKPPRRAAPSPVWSNVRALEHNSDLT